ncbi:hypothetical protein G352_24106 [Rhodococcus ruber BKS 20-38]|uniref:Lycopene cyclase domain-containing protein n=1 Tax=Rhodococcus ruber BKS 20-38 TaxID=1278076 RepID=M2WX71_9NOCA|nr:hypothetical protein G352_24106 [Rhodococcus ruber BKS 20-38]
MVGVDLFRALVFMCSLFASAAWCLARPHALSVTALATSSFLWLPFNGPLEGEVLYSLDPAHGITESDLLSLVGFFIVIWGFWAACRRRYGRGGPGRWF